MLIHNRLGVPAFSCEMLNSFHCFVDIVCLVVNFFVFVSEVLVHYNRNLDAAFVKYIKICNVTKPFLCIWNSTQHLHEKKKKKDGSFSDCFAHKAIPLTDANIFSILFFFLPSPTYSTLSAHCSLSLSETLSQSFTDWQLDRKRRVLD